jgi:hypothetical protein
MSGSLRAADVVLVACEYATNATQSAVYDFSRPASTMPSARSRPSAAYSVPAGA